MDLGLWLTIAGLILTAGAYFITQKDIFGVVSKFRASRAATRRSKINNDIKSWVIKYYFENGEGKNLVSLPNGKKIPYLSRKSWHGRNLKPDKVRFKLQNITTNLSIDNSIIGNRKLLGQNIWNGKIFSISGIVEGDDEITINIKRSTYYEYLTVADRMANEAEKCYGGSLTAPNIRHNQAKTFFHLQNNEPGIQLLGFVVAVVLNMDDGDYILVQRRAEETGIAEDKWAIVPTYVCEPLDFNYPVGFALHYFLLEFYEELLDKEELVEENRHLRPDWFYNDEPIKTILSLGDKFKFDLIGLGFDAITTEFNVAALAYFSDIEYCRALHNSIKRNWEIKHIKLIKLFSEEYHALLSSDDLYHTSAFALTCLNDFGPKLQNQVVIKTKIGTNKRRKKKVGTRWKENEI